MTDAWLDGNNAYLAASLAWVRARLKLVARLKGYKESRGMSFVDPEREEWMLQYLTRANRGPLSGEGLRELFDEILGLTKREVERGESG